MICNQCNREVGDAAVCPYCRNQILKEPLPHHLPAGTIIGGRYRIEGVLGEGGFGITYLGCNTKLDLPVAVKEYFPHGLSFRSAVSGGEVYVSAGNSREFFEHGKSRFLDEAKTLVRFSDEPGIVSVMDFVEENNTAYLIMEYLSGTTLLQYLRQHGTLSAQEAFTMLEPVMKTLEKIHEAGVIHRDISPDNIMRLKNGQLKLMDFGAARRYLDETRSMSVMLKKGYAPEEQYRRSGKQGPWTDVYALCATIYRCITGRAPDDALDRVMDDELTPPSALGADITPRQEQVLLYGLAVRRDDRCPTVTELRSLFKRASEQPDQIYPDAGYERYAGADRAPYEYPREEQPPVEPEYNFDVVEKVPTAPYYGGTMPADEPFADYAARPADPEDDHPGDESENESSGAKKGFAVFAVIAVLVAMIPLIVFSVRICQLSNKDKQQAASETQTEERAAATETAAPATEAPTDGFDPSSYSPTNIHVYENNAQGVMIKESVYDGNDTLTGWYEAKVDSSGKRTNLTHYDENGNVTQEDRYEYNSHGDCTSYIAQIPGEDGYRGFYYEYEYNEQGQITREITYNIVKTLMYDVTYIYDANGNVVQEIHEGMLPCSYEMEYDDNGNMIKKTYIDEDGTSSSYHQFEYDDNGNLFRQYDYSTGVRYPSSYIECEYDENGYLIRETTYRS